MTENDNAIITDAVAHSNERLWDTVFPGCAQATGSEKLAESLGARGCIDLLRRLEQSEESGGVGKVYREVAEVRPGLRESSPNTEAPLFLAMLAITQEGELFKEELSQHFGPDEAERIWLGFPCTAISK